MVPITIIKPFDIPPQMQTYLPERQTDKHKVLELGPFIKPERDWAAGSFQPKECFSHLQPDNSFPHLNPVSKTEMIWLTSTSSSMLRFKCQVLMNLIVTGK